MHALENPHVKVLGHPTARMLGEREGIDFDVEAVLKEAAKRSVAIELNTSAERLDLPDIYLKRAKELGIKICINADAHSIRGFSYDFGVSQARRGWLEKRDVMNTLPWSAFVKKPGSWKLEAVSSRHGSHSTDGNSYSAHAPEEAP
ncbi:hypothetical protein HYT95_00235 [Candidatus Peregrinibacteria bacterium]|nr:hypothetical protein [Candidatus Peregrinibacteria bacterium]